MTPDFHDLALERDDTLIKGLCYAARNTRSELREWAERELKAVLFEAEIQERTVKGVVGDQIKSTVERLRMISLTDMPEAIRTYEDVIDEVLRGGSTDVYDAYDQLQMGCTKLVRIVKELLQIRAFIGEMGDG